MALNIGLDWDDTFTAHPEAFVEFITLFRSKGHKVYITTARHPLDTNECIQILEGYGLGDVEVHGTTYKAKRKHMKDLGIHIDIWIDDHPLRINFDEAEENKLWEFF